MRYALRKAGICLLLLLSAMVLLVIGPASADGFLPTREYNGQRYEARSPRDLTTILLIGYDHMSEGQEARVSKDYAHGGQSDFLLLVVMDHEAERIHRLQIDRDTMTPIKMYGVYGGYLGPRKMQICLAHSYGKTQEDNNANAIWAVENLLGIQEENDGAQIDWYMSMDISGISRLNDALGGVTVPIEDDFSKYDPAMVQGTTMRLVGKQAEYYCRARYNIGDGSNHARMSRQRVYMAAAAELLVKETRKNVNFPRQVLNDMGLIYDVGKTLDDGFGFSTKDHVGTPTTDAPGKYLMTNETMDGIVGQISRGIDYELLDVEYLSGQYSYGSDGFVQFNLDEGVAEAWAMNVFYEPIR